MKIPIPDDWNGEDWQCVQISWPKSDLWLALLHGLLSTTMRGRYWDERTGTIKDAQAIGWEIWGRNTPLVDCASEPIPPDNGGGGLDIPVSSVYAPMGGVLEDLEMPCFDISGLLKIENGHLYARDSCCEWQDIGAVGTVEDLPISLWDGSDPAPTYYACAKADAVIDAMLAVINGVFDAAGDWNPLSWIGTVEDYVPGYNLSNTVVASMLAQVPIAAALGVSQSDMTDATKVQILKCQFVSLLQSDNTGVSTAQYDALSGILSGVFGLVAGNMWLLAKAALGRGNLNNIAIAAGTNAEANCDCPEQSIDYQIPTSHTWAKVFDFTIEDYGFVASGADAVYNDGVGWGWNSGDCMTKAPCWIKKSIEQAGGTLNYIMQYTVWPANIGTGGADPHWFEYDSTSLWYDVAYARLSPLSRVVNQALSTGHTLGFMKWQDTYGPVNTPFLITKIVLAGTGTDPFPSYPDA